MSDACSECLPVWGSYEQLLVRYDPCLKAVWYTLAPHPRPCFNLGILDELRRLQARIRDLGHGPPEPGRTRPVQYTVLASSVPGIFNLGGDLKLFSDLIRRQDEVGLFNYARACIDVLHPNLVSYEQPLTTISLVQGDALGGGFEAAISSNVIIAEARARFGLPEILFNLIPGMGAYSLLIRRTTPEITRRLICGGETYTARQMCDLGVIDLVVPDGEGEQAVADFIRQHRKKRNAYTTLERVRHLVNPITYEELIEVTRVWVAAALQLTPRDLRLIAALARAQDLRFAAPSPMALPKALESHG
ncbi:MAG: crotonase/enoyl-CoA hydratase family protein [Candidatus Krumholzibacteriia bacterium]